MGVMRVQQAAVLPVDIENRNIVEVVKDSNNAQLASIQF